MDSILSFFGGVYSSLAAIPFGRLIVVALAAFGGLMALFALGCVLSPALRACPKRPVLHFVNAFTAVFAALLAIGLRPERTLFFGALFWLAGYLYYGAVCALTARRPSFAEAPALTFSSRAPRPAKSAPADCVPPAAQGGVRLGHALAIADKLLLKPLSRADRGELERIKTTLSVLQVKGELSPQEGEIVNSHFSALLKLMSKYGY